MLKTFDVKGAEIEAYVYESERPIYACLSAPQSLAPSPHIPTIFPVL